MLSDDESSFSQLLRVAMMVSKKFRIIKNKNSHSCSCLSKRNLKCRMKIFMINILGTRRNLSYVS